MKAWTIQLLSIIAVVGAYQFIIFSFVPATFQHQVQIAVGIIGLVFLLSSLLMSIGKNVSSEARVQRFMIGTTLQLLIALFTILLANYISPKSFRQVATHFMVVFGVLLAVQAVFLVLQAKGKLKND
jgi:predicted MFS family arabinose efflux permease